ncbi:hypothetical protein PV05_04090 [Exophiala xenobiotica]|uniref:Dihydrofolate reductase n=1 Tax=Exophiala xenobiotica TaxID=348802 RepID=A0A0D2EY72_9EURO|nr:uncharacterized protein PV05_04090 [Exophiala xenobiotica]KIW59655.1 hypothetical protein PV05_04090 [Exophiala xenobiotica]
MTTIPTPPSTTLSEPPSPTERPTTVSFIDPFEDDDENKMSATKRIIKTTTTTITPIRLHPKPVYVIVATSLNPPMGIGNQGDLPWPPIKADMAFFRKVTSHIAPSEAASTSRAFNAVVMGRKTWESIPAKFRPLSNRVNVIITRSKSSDLGRRIIEQLKTSQGENGEWTLHEFATSSKPRKSKPLGTNNASTILTPPSSTPAQAPILITPSLPSILSMLSKSTITYKPSGPSTESTAQSITINKIFCIGGAEIYRQILSMSSVYSDRVPLSNATNQPDSETETDTDGEGEGDSAFDVRILQTQVRKIPSPESTSSSTNLCKQRSPEPDFECDTFFPDLLPADPTIKSAKWKPLLAQWLNEWIDGVEVPQAQAQRQSEADADSVSSGWYKDEKAGIEIRVVGWERRGARSDSVISLPHNFKA